MLHLAPRGGVAPQLLVVLLTISGCTENKRPRAESPPMADAGTPAQSIEVPGDWNRPLRGPMALVHLPESSSDGGDRTLVNLEHLPADQRLLHLLGTRVVDNRYSSVVLVETSEPAIPVSCSGILIHPRMVLTASHCVCRWRETHPTDGDKQLHVDSTACARRAKVTAIRYELTEDGSWSALNIKHHEGDVRPHPGFRLHRSTRPSAVTSDANLAVILLDKPDSLNLPIIALAEADLQPHAPLLIAGFGNNGLVPAPFGYRYTRKGKAQSAPPSRTGRIRFDPEGLYLHEIQQGWACLRESAKGVQLVGIVDLGTETEMSFTSTHFYRVWLRTELRLAAAAPLHGKTQ